MGCVVMRKCLSEFYEAQLIPQYWQERYEISCLSRRRYAFIISHFTAAKWHLSGSVAQSYLIILLAYLAIIINTLHVKTLMYTIF